MDSKEQMTDKGFDGLNANEPQEPKESEPRGITLYEKVLSVTIICAGSALLIGALALGFVRILGLAGKFEISSELSFGKVACGILISCGIIGAGGCAWKNPAYWDRPFGKLLKFLIPGLLILFTVRQMSY